MTKIICNECETVAHCMKNGCVPKQPAYRAVKTYHEGKPVYVAEQPASMLEKLYALSREVSAEQPAQQEPLEYWNAVEGWVKIDEVRKHFDSVGCATIYKSAGDGRVPLTSAQRKPLTEGEIERMWFQQADIPTAGQRIVGFARAIEAKLKELNT